MTFEFIPKYLPGPHNSFADAFSRSFDDSMVVNVVNTEASVIKVINLDTNTTLMWEVEKRGKRVPLEEQCRILIEQDMHWVIF